MDDTWEPAEECQGDVDEEMNAASRADEDWEGRGEKCNQCQAGAANDHIESKLCIVLRRLFLLDADEKI